MAERYEKYERYGHGYVTIKWEKIVVLFLLTVMVAFAAGMFADKVFADFSTETVSSPSEVGTGPPEPAGAAGTAGTVGAAIANTSANESEAEMEKIDSDGDGMSDWFEENYMHTDPNVVNDRYLLYVTANPLESKWSKETQWVTKMLQNFISAYKFAPENIIIIENATFLDFKEAVDKIAKKADENDFVYVQLIGHGAGPHREYEVVGTRTITREDGTTREIAAKFRMKKEWTKTEPFMIFAGYEGVTYKEIGEVLDKIKCQKMLVFYFSCASNTGVEPLNETLNKNPKYSRVIMGAEDMSFGIGKSFSRDGTIYIETPLYQKINNSYLSMKEYYQYDKDNYDNILEQELAKIRESIENGRILEPLNGDVLSIEVQRIKIADPYNIAETFYFGEAKVKDLYKPRPI